MEQYTVLVGILLIVIMIMGIFRNIPARITVYDYERALLYKRGRLDRVLGPGRYWYRPAHTLIRRVDMRPLYLTVSGQEVLTADSVSVKASLACSYEIADPVVACNQVQNFADGVYLELQLALRRVLGEAAVAEILAGRSAFGERLSELAAGRIGELGVRLIRADIKDIMFPGVLKETFGQVAAARQESLAALERARGEAAAVRKLANTAGILARNPAVLQLRMIQALGNAEGNTIILNIGAETVPTGAIPARVKE